jgi:hypothetical protein
MHEKLVEKISILINQNFSDKPVLFYLTQLNEKKFYSY